MDALAGHTDDVSSWGVDPASLGSSGLSLLELVLLGLLSVCCDPRCVAAAKVAYSPDMLCWACGVEAAWGGGLFCASCWPVPAVPSARVGRTVSPGGVSCAAGMHTAVAVCNGCVAELQQLQRVCAAYTQQQQEAMLVTNM